MQWVRQHLVESEEIDGSTRGLWKLTEKGRARLTKPMARGPVVTVAAAADSLRDLANKSRDEAKARLLTGPEKSHLDGV